MNDGTIKSLMTKDVISVTPETPLMDAVNLMLSNSFTGIPVVNQEGIVQGLLSEQDMVINGESLHLPTLMKLLTEFDFYKKETYQIKNDLVKLFNLKVADAMNHNPILISHKASVEEANKIFADHPKANPLPVVDDNKKLVGVLALYDLLKLYGVHVQSKRAVDKNVDEFINKFERQFVLVSKFRTQTWWIASLLFAVVGFIIAFMLI